MSLQKIKDTILSDAKKDAGKIIEEARERVLAKLIQEKTKAEETLNEKYAIFEKTLEDEMNRALSMQRTDHKMDVLRIKNSMIEEVFTRAVDKFISDNEYWNAMKRWLRSVSGPGRIFVNARDQDRINKELFNSEAGEDGLKGHNDGLVVEKESANIKGGFILKTPKYEIDHTLETIMSSLKTEIAPLIARELFANKGKKV